jgi:hypothetical protein
MMKPYYKNALNADDEAQLREYSEGWWRNLITRMLWRLMMKPYYENVSNADDEGRW